MIPVQLHVSLGWLTQAWCHVLTSETISTLHLLELGHTHRSSLSELI